MKCHTQALITIFLSATLLLVFPQSAPSQDAGVFKDQIETLKKENETLRRENDQLRRLLVEKELAHASTTNTPASNGTPSDKTTQPSPAPSRSLSFWMSSTGKRHNPTCRYYGTGKGHQCGPTEGVACKICGG
jgi:hypothetical protein